MKNIKHLFTIHAVRLAVLLAVLAPLKGQSDVTPLPAGWSDADIGSPPGLSGSANYDNGLWTVKGGGADIWNAADQFNFASTNFTGDGTMIAQVTSLQNSDPGSGWSKAGLMFRNDSTAGSVNVSIVATAGNGVSFQWRSTADGQCSAAIAGGVTAPVWLKLVRSGQTFTGYYSSDGTNWFQVTSVWAAMSGTVMAGLDVTAHNNLALNTATFTNVSLLPNLVLNGGFETGDFTDWNLTGSYSHTYVDSGLWSGILPHSGSYEAVLPTGGSFGYLSQTVPNPLPGQIQGRLISFWMNNMGVQNVLHVYWDGNILYSATNNALGWGWTNIQVDTGLYFGEGGGSVLQFEFENGSYYVGLGLDDISVTLELPPPYTYTTNNGTITITGYAGPGGAVAIPDTINDLPVTTIGSGAFQNYTSLTSVIIPGSVTNLGNAVFSNCTSLANVTIGTNVTRIGNSAFQNCASLTSVTIPGSVTNIGDYAFAECGLLTGVYFQGNAPIPGGDSTVFANDTAATVYYLPGTTGWNAPTFDGRPAVLLNPPYLCTTANGAITIIGYTGSGGAVTISDTINGLPVTAISSGAFQNCASLTSVTIPASVTNIADTAFQNCSSLAGVYFLGNPPSLGGLSVFSNDNNAIGYNAAGTTGWGLTFDGLTMVLANNSTINGTNHYAYGANLGWLDWRSDTNHGAVIRTNVCSGYIYSANFGWINLGNGSPANGLYYQNNSASDFGVNVDGSGNLNGYAYGANIGWINFEANGAPKVDLASGSLSGSVWSANWGWISLSNVVAYVQTSPIQQSSPSVTAPILGGITFTSSGGSGSGFGFSFTNVPGASFTVWTSTDLTQPFSSWTKVGTVTEVPGVSYSQYQFTDPLAGNQVQQFYRVSSP